MQYVAGQNGAGTQATWTHSALPRVTNRLQHLFSLRGQLVFQWLVVNYFVAIGLAIIDCARLMHALSDSLDGHYPAWVVNPEFEFIYINSNIRSSQANFIYIV